MKDLKNLNAHYNINRFVCEVGCNPKPDIAWTFNGAPLVEGDRHKIKTNGNTRSA